MRSIVLDQDNASNGLLFIAKNLKENREIYITFSIVPMTCNKKVFAYKVTFNIYIYDQISQKWQSFFRTEEADDLGKVFSTLGNFIAEAIDFENYK